MNFLEHNLFVSYNVISYNVFVVDCLLNIDLIFFLLRLAHPTPGIEPGGQIEVCD